MDLLLLLALLAGIFNCYLCTQSSKVKRRVLYHMHKDSDDLAMKVKGTIGPIPVDDEDLLWFIGTRILGPAKESYKEFLDGKLSYKADSGQSGFVDDKLNKTSFGFFVDIGSGRGRNPSNTLLLEKRRSWTGLLIEPNQRLYRNSLRYQRKSLSLNACVSTRNKTHYAAFESNLVNSWMVGTWPLPKEATHLERLLTQRVECFPLASILMTLNITTIDYLSLDVGGTELSILKTVPFWNVTIRIMSVSFGHESRTSEENTKSLIAIKDFIKTLNMFDYAGVLPKPRSGSESDASDAMFVRKSIKHSSDL